jgi:hypothetical protein
MTAISASRGYAFNSGPGNKSLRRPQEDQPGTEKGTEKAQIISFALFPFPFLFFVMNLSLLVRSYGVAGRSFLA